MLLVTAGALLSGCATASKPQAMAVAAPIQLANQHPYSVSVHVMGGKETSASGASQISSEDFATAVRSSIEASELFSSVLEVDAADHHIEVWLVRLSQPLLGFSMTVELEANWTLTRRSDGHVVWRQAITSSHTAHTSEAFAGATRLRLANEGAARANIEQALQAMAAVDLNATP